MSTIKTKDFTGHSNLSIDEAIANALEKAGKHRRVKVIETRSSQHNENNSQYQVTLTTQDE